MSIYNVFWKFLKRWAYITLYMVMHPCSPAGENFANIPCKSIDFPYKKRHSDTKILKIFRLRRGKGTTLTRLRRSKIKTT